jgi:outer membrane protein assembly factor BamD (BamD/ComL family)
MSQYLTAYLEKSSIEQRHDYALRVIYANFCFIKNEPQKALSLLRGLARDAASSDYGEYAKFTLNLYSCFDDSNRPEICYKSYEQIAQAIFDKKNRHKWDDKAVTEYTDMLRGRASEKWAPFSFIELLEHFYLNEDYQTALNAAEFVTSNYPQSWWDAKARARRLDIEYGALIAKFKRYKELGRMMEFKKGCGALQEQADIDEKLLLEGQIKESTAEFEESVINLAQRYKSFKIAREPFFKLSYIFEESGSQRDVLRVLSHVNNNFNEYPDGAKAHFEIGMYYFRSENYQLALQFFNNYLIDYENGREAAQATFMTGKTLQMQNRLTEAISFYKKALAAGEPVWIREASNSALEVCKTYYNAKKYQDALGFLSDMRAGKFDEGVMAEAAYLEGSCNRELSFTAPNPAEARKFLDRATDNFSHLMQRYPESSQASLASAAFDEIRSGRISDSMLIARISNAIIAFFVLGFFILLGVSYSRQDEPLFYFIFALQAGFVTVIFFTALSFKFFGKLWEILFG